MTHMCYDWHMVVTVGVRELQQHSSRLVRDVEQGVAEYHVSIQGRDTGVMLTKVQPTATHRGVPASQALSGPLWNREISEDARQQLLAWIEAGRDAMGSVGE